MSTSQSSESDSTTRPLARAGEQQAAFVTTHWSVVQAAQQGDTTGAEAALARLCQSYWYPLYAYVRRRGYGPEDAQDLTQEFFARLLAQHWLGRADPERGRFRTYLLAALSHFLSNEWRKASAQKRGGAAQFIPIQLGDAETRYGMEPVDPLTPEQIYERRWAIALLDEVLNRLCAEHLAAGSEELFETLKPCLLGARQNQPYAELAAKLRTTEGAVKTAVYRLRSRYRQILQDEIRQTVSSREEAEDEMRHLFSALGR